MAIADFTLPVFLVTSKASLAEEGETPWFTNSNNGQQFLLIFTDQSSAIQFVRSIGQKPDECVAVEFDRDNLLGLLRDAQARYPGILLNPKKGERAIALSTTGLIHAIENRPVFPASPN